MKIKTKTSKQKDRLSQRVTKTQLVVKSKQSGFENSKQKYFGNNIF